MEPEEDEGSVAAGEEFDPANYDPEDFDDFVGRYALDANPAFVVEFTREGGSFYTQATNQQRLEIVPTSDSTFSLTQVQASVTFLRNEDGDVEGLNLHQGGQVQHASRLDEDMVEAWEPDAEALKAFEGRYFSEELETFYTITLEEGDSDEDAKLVMRQRRMDDATLTPGEKDAFSGGGLNYSFERDRNGQVIGFYVANTRTRDVRFERVR